MMTRPGPFGGQFASGERDRWNDYRDVGAFRSNIDVAGTGVHAKIGEIAAAERINPSYASRVLRLTLLAPDVVEAILDGRQGPEVKLENLLRPFPVAWESQSRSLPTQHGIRSSERGSRMALTPSDNSAAIGPR